MVRISILTALACKSGLYYHYCCTDLRTQLR
jgi:hypothetical protein